MVTIWLIDRDVEFSAGEEAPAGFYCRSDEGSGAIVQHRGGHLTASYDGRRAVYVRAWPANLPSTADAQAHDRVPQGVA